MVTGGGLANMENFLIILTAIVLLSVGGIVGYHFGSPNVMVSYACTPTETTVLYKSNFEMTAETETHWEFTKIYNP